MDAFKPAVWQTCRVLANEKRLKMLWQLFVHGEMSMGQLARAVDLKEPNASKDLKMLNACGLVRCERRRNYVFYSAAANPEIAHSEALLDALKQCHCDGWPFERVILMATAFTHPRRIDIVQALGEGAVEKTRLSVTTQISPQSLYRHLRKLKSRGFVAKEGQEVRLLEQTEKLPGALLAAALG
ncbi:hypothetical protein PDESU_05145 [Pontiella desulfatans]|uniref:HTH arsR-type domain-containing protein n=1 Tax=Pontiella desulfatans TaxID=2750659 RepID=A0A6C2UB23_PONDE|nr:metalloregulator ArsR/SmtB family transcription factor [Pontiella desulfatans]VGO16554.1 hypothetical protein PDESU_05145 [Pontiella desulfatans]